MVILDLFLFFIPISVKNKITFWLCGFYFRVALDRAAVLLTMKRKMVRLDNVWGVGGGLRPVKHLVKEVRQKTF